jgi:quinol monooxygenase YgiN
MILVLATLELAPGARPEFLRAFGELAPLVQAEAGCLEYRAAIDLETLIPLQPPVRPDVVTIVEKWSSVPDLEAHLIAPHMREFRARAKPWVVSTSLQVLTPQ